MKSIFHRDRFVYFENQLYYSFDINKNVIVYT